MPNQQPVIFLCHASEDKPQVQKLYRQLKAAGYRPWLDKEDLLPGQSWRREIRKVISDPNNLVVVCLSGRSTTKRGVVQQEIKWALDVLDQQPEESIYLIPARLEACPVPERLQDLHWVDLFEADGLARLQKALDFELGQRQPVAIWQEQIALSPQAETAEPAFISSPEPDLVLIPAGEFLMGSDPEVDKAAREEEQPQHRLYLPEYYIGKTPVTNAQYAAFVQQTGHRQPEHWKKWPSWKKGPPPDRADHPVVHVRWHDAVAYCRWLTKETGRPYRLPTEAEWEKAARGKDGRIYPWGHDWDPVRCNTREGGPKEISPVGAYPDGASPYGVFDMAGNVWEWCATRWKKEYPYQVEEEWTEAYLGGTEVRVLRGGSWVDGRDDARCMFRFRIVPDFSDYNVGFRVVSPI